MIKGVLRSIFELKKISNLVSKDWSLKFISLVLAVVLWFFVGGEDRVDKNVMLPIEIINLPRDLVISNQFKKEIEVTVSGPRSLILEMANKSITRQVDLSAATPGTMVIENDNDHIPVLRGITVQRVTPSSIILSLDKLIQKQYPVSAKTVGNVADGYYVKTLKTDPDVITITGPLTTLSQFDELFTKAINLAGVKQSAQLQVPLELDPAIVELIGETSVTADLTVGLETVTKTIEQMVVDLVVDGTQVKVTPATVKIAANIPKMLLGKYRTMGDLFSVTALKVDDSDLYQVKVIPKNNIEYPIEILSIIPTHVLLENDNPSPVYDTNVLSKSLESIVPIKDVTSLQQKSIRKIKRTKTKKKIIQ
ncbi:CdaR family protein [Desulforhopalus sp. 52FAK]